MKTLLSKPKILIPIFVVIGLAVVIIVYPNVGRAPSVTLSPDTAVTTTTLSNSSDTSLDLAFPKAGRIASVAVASGDKVKKGDVLASLDAGDALGAVNQAKGALELAQSQYASLDVQYANAKNQQDVLVANALRTLLSSGLTATAQKQQNALSTAALDAGQAPTITGTYTCDAEGSYDVSLYASGAQSGYSFTLTGLEKGSGTVTYYTPQPLGTCGLSIQFPAGYSAGAVDWIIQIPNTKSSSYAANKNAYDLAVVTRDQVLAQIKANTTQASIDAAQGTYQAAVAAYQNDLIVAPVDGTVSFVDPHLKVGQSVMANKTVISISQK